MTERQQQLVAQIPQGKAALFAYPVAWDVAERHDLVAKKLRPWVGRKMQELLGEEERTLLDFICAKLQHRCGPQDLLRELKLVLEEDADLFVQKLWRILIYHVLVAE